MTAPVEGSRIETAEKQGWSESWSAYNNERTWSILDALNEIAGQTGKSVAQVSLNWLLNRSGVTAPIIGVRTPGHLADNLGASGWSLTPEQMARLTAVSDTPLPIYPYGFVNNAQRS